MSTNHGDLRLGDVLDFKFATVDGTGAPTTLAGSPALACYPANSTTEITAGVNLTADFDSRTGLNHVRITASSGNGYAVATEYDVVVTAGTIGGVSAVGYVVGKFSVEKRFAGLDFDNHRLTASAPIPALGVLDYGTAQSVTSTSVTLRAGFSATADVIIGASLYFPKATNGLHSRGVVTAWNNSTKVATISPAFTQTPTGDLSVVLYATAANNFDLASASIAQMRTAFELNSGNYRLTSAALAQAANSVVLRSSTATATGTTTSFTDSSITESGTDALRFLKGRWTGGANVGRAFAIYGSNGTAVNFSPAMPNAVASGDAYELYRGGPEILAGVAHTGAVIPTVSTVAAVSGGVTVTTNNDKSNYALSNAGIDAVLDRQIAEPTGPFAWNAANLRNIAAFLGALARNKTISSQSGVTVRNSGDTLNIAQASIAIVNGVMTRGPYA